MRRSLLIFALPLVACIGTTGGDVVDFPVEAAGPATAVAGMPYSFQTERGWNVTLTQAKLHIGAIYLSAATSVSGAQTTNCILPGTYVAQVTTGMDVDLLSGVPQRFPVLGHGTTLPSLTGQVWLTGGKVDDNPDATVILAVTGTAERAGDARPFTGQLTISTNRVAPSTGTIAGSNVICKQRIVTPITTTGLVVESTGGLMLRIDPRYLFTNVDFTTLGKFTSGYGFSDDPTNNDPSSPLYYSQASLNLYNNMRSGGDPTKGALYSFAWDATMK